MGFYVARCRWRSWGSRLVRTLERGVCVCVYTVEADECTRLLLSRALLQEERVCIAKNKRQLGRGMTRELSYLLLIPNPLKTQDIQVSGPGPLFPAAL